MLLLRQNETDGWDEICITRGNRLRRSEGNRPVQKVSARSEDNIKKGIWQDAMMLAEVYWLVIAFIGWFLWTRWCPLPITFPRPQFCIKIWIILKLCGDGYEEHVDKISLCKCFRGKCEVCGEYEQAVDRRDIDKLAKRGYCFPESDTPPGHSAPYVVTAFPSVSFHYVAVAACNVA